MAANFLHRDFSSPALKSWGSQRHIRTTISGENRFTQNRSPEIAYVDDCGLEKLREKLMGHLRQAADRLKLDIPAIKPSSDAAETSIPWTLRKRRAQPASAKERNNRLRSDVGEKKETRKFSVQLLKEEIEDDVFALTGCRPRRRPKKRPRIVQRQIDAIFPGLLLSEITPERYRVPD